MTFDSDASMNSSSLAHPTSQVQIVLRDQRLHSLRKPYVKNREEETSLASKIDVEVVQSLRQESSVQDSDSSVRSGSVVAANLEEPEEDQLIREEEEEASTMESFQMKKLNWVNIFLLGGGFFLLFTAFQTTAFVQGVTLDSFLSPSCHNISTSVYHDGGIPISDGFAKRIGYISLCIIYLMVAIGNWVSVPIVAVFGAKWSLVISGALYVVYIIAVIRPYVPTLFLGAFILGSAGGVLWTAQGQILIQNSSKEKMSTTSGIFWFMLQQSLVFGNLFYSLYLKFRVKGDQCIAQEDNYIIFGVFTFFGVAGVVLMFFIVPTNTKKIWRAGSLNDDESKALLSEGTADSLRGHPTAVSSACQQAIKSLVKAVKILFSVDMLLLSVVFIYTGYELNFWSGVYGTVIGRTLKFPGYIVGVAGLFLGLGEILGGGLFGILGKYTNRFGKDPIVLLGLLVHFATFLLVYYNLPVQASFQKVAADQSFGKLFHPSNVYIAILCAFMLGFGDACFNTQIYSIIGSLYPKDEESAPAMALFKFFQSLAAMVGFVTSSNVNLQWQLLVLVILATLGTLTFAMVEWKHYKKPVQKS